MVKRSNTRSIKVGSKFIGGGAPVTVQSMLNIPAEDIECSISQAKALAAAGCDIIRAAIPTVKDVPLIYALKLAVDIPVVADIHFDYKIALECVSAGVDKIRINPGNIGSEDGVRLVARACHDKNIPIRIGVNGGSLEKSILTKYGGITPEALVESGMYHASLLQKYDFEDIVLSLKSSSLPVMYRAYLLAAEQCDFPLHLGVTEAGTEKSGLIKSSAGIGGLLLSGIGDTIRISLTADPVLEVSSAISLLKTLELREGGVNFVSCPTCGRTKIDLISLANEVEHRLAGLNKDITVAIMGCVVNGPGEAKEADIGICGGDGCGMIFKKGEPLRRVPEEQLIDELIKEIEYI